MKTITRIDAHIQDETETIIGQFHLLKNNLMKFAKEYELLDEEVNQVPLLWQEMEDLRPTFEAIKQGLKLG